MSEGLTQIELRIHPEPEADQADLERLTLLLHEELRDLVVESVDLPQGGGAPVGAKSAEPFTWGSLVIGLAASGGVLTTLIGVLQSWLSQHERSRVTIEIDGDRLELSGVTSEQQQRLIDIWIARHRSAEAKG